MEGHEQDRAHWEEAYSIIFNKSVEEVARLSDDEARLLLSLEVSGMGVIFGELYGSSTYKSCNILGPIVINMHYDKQVSLRS